MTQKDYSSHTGTARVPRFVFCPTTGDIKSSSSSSISVFASLRVDYGNNNEQKKGQQQQSVYRMVERDDMYVV